MLKHMASFIALTVKWQLGWFCHNKLTTHVVFYDRSLPIVTAVSMV